MTSASLLDYYFYIIPAERRNKSDGTTVARQTFAPSAGVDLRSTPLTTSSPCNALLGQWPANSSRVPVSYYLRPSIASATRYSCNAGNMTSSLVFSSSQTLKPLLYTKQNPFRDAGIPVATRYSRNAATMTSSPVFANPKASLIYKRRSVWGYRTSHCNAL